MAGGTGQPCADNGGVIDLKDRAAWKAALAAPCPIIAHLNADTTWLLQLPIPGPVAASPRSRSKSEAPGRSRFNILIDPLSATEIFRMAEEKKIDLTLIPTECVKETPFSLSWEKFTEITSPDECAHIFQLYEQWNVRCDPVNLFDILAAMAVTTNLYEGMLKVVRSGKEGDTFVFTDEEEAPESGPGLKMFWNGPSKRDPPPVSNEANKKEVPSLLSRKPDYLEELKGTLRYNESK